MCAEVKRLRVLLVQWDQRLASAALLRQAAVMRVAQEVFHRRRQKGPKPTSLPRGLPDTSFLQKSREELLGQILRLMRTMTALAYEGVNGQPVSLTQPGQRLVSRGRFLRPGRQHFGPVSRVKTSNGAGFGRLFRTIHLTAVCRKQATRQKRSLAMSTDRLVETKHRAQA